MSELSNTELKNLIESIPILSDEKVKEGNFDHIDDKSIVHFFIYPFLNTLGYNVFNPNELKLNYKKDDYEADVVIFKDGIPLSVFKLVNFDEELNKSSFTEDDIDGLKSLGASLVVLTNGLNYVLYSFIDNIREEFLRFSLDKLTDDSVDKIKNTLYKGILDRSVSEGNFFTEKIILSKLGSLSKTIYLTNIVKEELKNPSDKFIEILSETLVRKYGNGTDVSELKESLKEELSVEKGVLFENLFDENSNVDIEDFEIENKEEVEIGNQVDNEVEAGNEDSNEVKTEDREEVETENRSEVETGNQVDVETGNQVDVETGNQVDVETENQDEVETDNKDDIETGSQEDNEDVSENNKEGKHDPWAMLLSLNGNSSKSDSEDEDNEDNEDENQNDVDNQDDDSNEEQNNSLNDEHDDEEDSISGPSLDDLLSSDSNGVELDELDELDNKDDDNNEGKDLNSLLGGY